MSLFVLQQIIFAQSAEYLKLQHKVNADSYSYCEVETEDGGLIVVGATPVPSSAYSRGSIAKFGADGEVVWHKGFQDPTLFSDAKSVSLDNTSGGFFVAGGLNPQGNLGDGWVTKFNSRGQFVWTKTVGGTNADAFNSISFSSGLNDRLPGGNILAAGNTLSFGAGGYDMYVVKMDTSGSLIWNKTYGGTGFEYAISVVHSSDGGYAIGGSTNSFGQGNYDMFIVKTDTGGALQWSKTIGGPGFDDARAMIQTTDGGYILAGGTTNYGAGGYDFYIVKLSSNGTLQWTRTAGGSGDEVAQSIAQTSDGGYIVAGFTNSFGAGLYDIYVVKLDAGGTYQWSKTAGGDSLDGAFSIIKTMDGGYEAAGYTNSFGTGRTDEFLVKFDANGNTCSNTTTPSGQSGSGGIIASQSPVVTTPNSTLISRPPLTVDSNITVNTICVIGIQQISNEVPDNFSLEQNYPNPFNPATKIRFQVSKSTNIKIAVYDITGKEVETLVNEKMTAGTYETQFDGSKYSSGIYFYSLITGNFVNTKKMILVK